MDRIDSAIERLDEALREALVRQRQLRKLEHDRLTAEDRFLVARERVHHARLAATEEQADVDAITGIGAATLLAFLRRELDEEREREIGELVAATSELGTEELRLQAAESRLAEVDDRIAGLEGVDAEVERLRSEKEWQLLHRDGADALRELVEERARIDADRVEVAHAIEAACELKQEIDGLEEDLYGIYTSWTAPTWPHVLYRRTRGDISARAAIHRIEEGMEILYEELSDLGRHLSSTHLTQLHHEAIPDLSLFTQRRSHADLLDAGGETSRSIEALETLAIQLEAIDEDLQRDREALDRDRAELLEPPAVPEDAR